MQICDRCNVTASSGVLVVIYSFGRSGVCSGGPELRTPRDAIRCRRMHDEWPTHRARQRIEQLQSEIQSQWGRLDSRMLLCRHGGATVSSSSAPLRLPVSQVAGKAVHEAAATLRLLHCKFSDR